MCRIYYWFPLSPTQLVTDVQTEAWFSDFQLTSWSLSNTTLQVAGSKPSSPESEIVLKSQEM